MKNVMTGQAAASAAAQLSAHRLSIMDMLVGCPLITTAEYDTAMQRTLACQDLATLQKWYRNTVREIARREELEPVTAPIQYATGSQKEEIIKLANAHQISRAEKTHVLLTLDRLTTAEVTATVGKSVAEIMGYEGNIRQTYYRCFEQLVSVPGFTFGSRSTQPPQNELNALISFGNMLCYAACLSQIYHTQLNPTISFLHEPGSRRFSLALDMAEIFKPLLVDRTIFRLLNKKEIQPRDFVRELDGCLLKEAGRKTFVRVFEERLKETIQHRRLNRSVSYQHCVGGPTLALGGPASTAA